MKKSKDSHRKELERAFGAAGRDKPLEDLFEAEEREQFGTVFSGKRKKEDPQYEKLLGEFQGRRSGQVPDFTESEKYSGRKIERQDLENDSIENVDIEAFKEGKVGQKPRKIKKVKGKKSKVAVTKAVLGDVDELLDEIEAEDREETANQAEGEESSVKKARTVKNQLNTWKALLSLRLQMQPVLDSVKKYPKKAIPEEENRKNQLVLAFLIENLSKIQDTLLRGSSCEAELPSLPPFFGAISSRIDSPAFEIDSEEIFKEIESYYTAYFPWAERNLAKWSEKTQILSSNLSKTGLRTLLHTPIGQVNKMMEGFEKLQTKSQLKRGTYRILFEGLENLEKDYDEDIYDDSDLLQELLRTSLEQKLDNFAANNEEAALFETTRQFLAEKKLRSDGKQAKDIDRRASKNRKLRFEVHAKLINFMQCDDRGSLLEGREEIVRAIKRRFEGGNEEGPHKRIKPNGGEKDEPRLI